ncbi:MAG: hypothetical protein KQH79_08960 [Bacteroidetes bacterium]|nr:hypothetical protein [Bacteroidota bacterium]
MKAIRIFQIFLIVSVIAWNISCKSNKTTTSVDDNLQQQKNITQIIADYFVEKDSVEVIPNDEGNCELYVSNKTLSASEPINEVKFIVVDKSNSKVLYKNQFTRSSVKWFDNKNLLLTKQLGVLDKETGKGFIQYLIDIETNEMKEYTANKKNLE